MHISYTISILNKVEYILLTFLFFYLTKKSFKVLVVEILVRDGLGRITANHGRTEEKMYDVRFGYQKNVHASFFFFF